MGPIDIFHSANDQVDQCAERTMNIVQNYENELCVYEAQWSLGFVRAKISRFMSDPKYFIH